MPAPHARALAFGVESLLSRNLGQPESALYYRGESDASDAPLTGDNSDNSDTLTFPKGALPSRFAKYFWWVIAVEGARFRVLPNPLEKYLLNGQSG